MLFPIVLVCAVALSVVAGCDKVRKEITSSDPSCDPAQKPAAFRLVDDDAYLACRTLWPEKLRAMDGAPWLNRLLFNADPVAFTARQGLAAAGGPFNLACDNTFVRKDDIENLAQYRAASASFFRTYFGAPVNGADDGMMVFIAGIAPTDAGERVVIGAMNAFKIPTEKASPERDRRGAFTQLLKAAYFYNAAADRATRETRYKREHGRLKLAPKDAAFAREQLAHMKRILGDVERAVMTEAQQRVYDALSEASKNLARSVG